MKKRSKMLVVMLIVVALVLSMTACVIDQPIDPKPSPSPTVTSPDVTVKPSASPSASEKPGHGYVFPPDWDKPVKNEISIDKLNLLEGTGRYVVEKTDSVQPISIVNPHFEGTLVFNSLNAENKDITINMPKATIEFGDVVCANLNVTSGLNTVKFNGKAEATVTIYGGNAVVNASAEITSLKVAIDETTTTTSRVIDIKGAVRKLVLDTQMEVNISGTAVVDEMTATQPAQISVSGEAKLASFVNALAASDEGTEAIKTTLTIADNAAVQIANTSGGLVVDATAAATDNVVLTRNDGVVEVVKDVNSEDQTKGEIKVGDSVAPPVQTFKGILAVGENPITYIPKNGATGQLRFSFTHPENYDVTAIIMSRDGRVYLQPEVSSQVGDNGSTATFQWDLRDHSSLSENSRTKLRTLIPERSSSNEFLFRKDSEVVFSITATERTAISNTEEPATAKNQTLTYNYKVTDTAEKNSAVAFVGAESIAAVPTTLFSKVESTLKENHLSVEFAVTSEPQLHYYDVASIFVTLYRGNDEIASSAANFLAFSKEQSDKIFNYVESKFYAENFDNSIYLKKGKLYIDDLPPTRATLTIVTRDGGKTIVVEQSNFTNEKGDAKDEIDGVLQGYPEDYMMVKAGRDNVPTHSQSYKNMFNRVLVGTADELKVALEDVAVKEIVAKGTAVAAQTLSEEKFEITLTEKLIVAEGKKLIVTGNTTFTIPSGITLEINCGAEMLVRSDADFVGNVTRAEGSIVNIFVADAAKLKTYIEAGQYATLQSDIEIQFDNIITIQNGKLSVLNMNGKKITYNNTGNKLNGTSITKSEAETRPITNSGDLSIFGDGKFVVMDGCLGFINNFGVANIENCEFTTSDSKTKGSVLRNRPGATMTLTNVNVYSTSKENASSQCVYNDGTLTIEGGKFDSQSGLTTKEGSYAISATETTNNFTISNVTVHGAKGALALVGGVSTVKSGKYTATNYYAAFIAGESADAMATIEGGTFESAGIACVLVGNNIVGDGGEMLPAFAKITGGTFKAAEGKPVLKRDDAIGTVVVVGGTFSQDIDSGTYESQGFVNAAYECVAGDDGMFVVKEKEFASNENELIAKIANAKKGDTIKIFAGTITLTAPLRLPEYVIISGQGIGVTTINGRIIALKSLGLKDLTVEAETGLSEGVITSSGVDSLLSLEKVKVIQNKTGIADSFAGMSFGIFTENVSDTDSPDNASVSLKDSEILLNGKYQRGINIGGSATGGTITLDNSKITSSDNPSNASFCRGISTYEMTDMVVNVLNGSRIEGVYYAINVSTDVNLVVNVDNSFVAGYAAINCHSNNTTFNIKNNSTLEGRNNYEKGANDFATIVINMGKTGVKINIDNSTIKNIAGGESAEYLIDVRSEATNAQINITGTSKLINEKNNVAIKTNYVVGTIVNIEETVTFGGAYGANDANFDSEKIITLGIGTTEVMNENVDKTPTVKLCRFVPTESGKYNFVGNVGVDSVLVILDKNGAYKAVSENKSSNERHFDLIQELIGGRTYYYYIGTWDEGETKVEVTIAKLP